MTQSTGLCETFSQNAHSVAKQLKRGLKPKEYEDFMYWLDRHDTRLATEVLKTAYAKRAKLISPAALVARANRQSAFDFKGIVRARAIEAMRVERALQRWQALIDGVGGTAETTRLLVQKAHRALQA
jgi:hypothetical protein